MRGCQKYSALVGAAARKDLLQALLQQPAVQRLAPDAVAPLLPLCIKEELHHPLLLLRSELPAAVQGAFGQDAVRRLLQSAFEMRQWDTYAWLMRLPAAPPVDAEVAMWCAVRACQSTH
jgi:hypothetical protein